MTACWKARRGLALGAHALTGGFEARDESLADPGLPGESVSRSRALFLQDELAITPRFSLTMGLRHDRYQLFGTSGARACTASGRPTRPGPSRVATAMVSRRRT